LPLHDFGQFVAVENGSVAIGFRDGISELRSPLHDTAVRVAHSGEVVAVAMTPDGTVRSVGFDGALTWHAAPVESRLSAEEVDDVAASRDGSIVVTVTSEALHSRNHRLNVYRNGRSAGDFGGWKFDSVAFDAHDHLFAGTRDGQLLHWRSVDDVGRTQPETVKDAQPPVLLSPSGAYRLYATPGVRRRTAKGSEIVGTIFMENVKSGQRVELPHLAGSVRMTFGSDDTIVTAADDGTIRVWKWRVDRTHPAAVFKARPRTMFVAASRDDAWIAAGSREWPTMIWKVSAPDRPYATLERVAAMIDFDPLQPSLITADRDGIARVWNLQDRPVEIARFPAVRWGTIARFSSDGRYAITASSHDGVRLHLWRDEDLASEACRRLKSLRGTADLAGYDSICGLTR
jgi:WD40 repeat protein